MNPGVTSPVYGFALTFDQAISALAWLFYIEHSTDAGLEIHAGGADIRCIEDVYVIEMTLSSSQMEQIDRMTIDMTFEIDRSRPMGK